MYVCDDRLDVGDYCSYSHVWPLTADEHSTASTQRRTTTSALSGGRRFDSDHAEHTYRSVCQSRTTVT